MAMEEDSYGNLWLTTDKSLANIVWGKDGIQPQNTTSCYLPELEFGHLSLARESHRQLWSVAGVAIHHHHQGFAALRWYKDRLKTRNSLQMGVILTNITHELLTPLTVISATIYKLKGIAPQYIIR